MESKILELFLYHKKLKFNQIEKLLKTRSNKLAYHIKQLVKKEILIKDKENYSLSNTAEKLIPYLSEKRATLPVILIHIGDNKKAFLINRNKRPFKDKLSLPGGRLLINESIPNAAKRIMKEKFNVNIHSVKTKSITLEHVKKSNKIIHSFLLILITAKTKEDLELTNIIKNKSKIISSDYKLITSKDQEIKISIFRTKI